MERIARDENTGNIDSSNHPAATLSAGSACGTTGGGGRIAALQGFNHWLEDNWRENSDWRLGKER